MTDSELLQRYCESRCEIAFTELVKRYIDLVYSAALRQVNGDPHLAQDVTQTVFIDLARKAQCLSKRSLLGGWLYQSTRYAAANTIRAQRRWSKKEHQANTMQESTHHSRPDAGWDQLRPVLDSAMQELNDQDRNAVLLRFFEDRHLAEVGAKLGLSEDAARKRVDRALDKLKLLLEKRGVTSTAAALATLLSTQVVSAAPAGLALQVAGVALASSAAGTGTGLTLLKIMTMTKLKLGIASVLLLTGVAAPLFIQNRAQNRLREENLALRQQNIQLTQRVTPLETENTRLSNIIARATEVRTVPDGPSNEVLKLRGELARLRTETRELSRSKAAGENDASIEATAQALAERASRLKHQLEQRPNLSIPELQFLSQKNWLDAASTVAQLESDEDIRQALEHLRSSAKANFGAKMQEALRQFGQANGGMLPTDLSQLQPFFDSPVDPALLARYQLLHTGKLSDNSDESLIAEIAPPVDNQHDTKFEFDLNGVTSHRVNSAANP